jgi:hypothetical protein
MGQSHHSTRRLPTNLYSLRELDIELMKRLSPRCNVIPVIGKADSLTPAELAESKKLVMEDIEHYRIPVYNFPYDIEEDDEDTVEENAELRGLMPFAIVGSEDIVEVNGRRVRARQYPWGIVEVDNTRTSWLCEARFSTAISQISRRLRTISSTRTTVPRNLASLSKAVLLRKLLGLDAGNTVLMWSIVIRQ